MINPQARTPIQNGGICWCRTHIIPKFYGKIRRNLFRVICVHRYIIIASVKQNGLTHDGRQRHFHIRHRIPNRCPRGARCWTRCKHSTCNFSVWNGKTNIQTFGRISKFIGYTNAVFIKCPREYTLVIIKCRIVRRNICPPRTISRHHPISGGLTSTRRNGCRKICRWTQFI